MPASIEQQIRDLASQYAATLKQRIEERTQEMAADDKSHYLIYRVLGISEKEGDIIDLYQNTGRFLYRYAGTFLERATRLCFEAKFPDAKALKIANTLTDTPKTFEIDCLIKNYAYEVKWRDATTDGDHIIKEHTRIKVIANGGYIPVRLMYYVPNRAQAIRIQSAIADLYKANNGFYYSGNEAWSHLKAQTDVDLYAILKSIAEE